MPLRSFCQRLAVLWLLCGNAAANNLNWMTAEQVNALPEDKRKPVPAWCGGIYYNPALAEPDAGGDTVITADQSKLTPGGEAELSGQVRIEQPGRLLQAERARFNQETGEFELTGDIHVELPDATFNARGMQGNSNNRQAELSNVEYAVFPIHARGSADNIEQKKQLILVTDGSYTTCKPGSNGWALHAGHLRLDREKGWGTARNVLLKVEGIPIAWIPWVTFPIDDRRKTGLLFPSIASSEAGGIDITQPIYLNLHPQLDATVAPRHIHGRGNGLETEVRYLAGFGQGSISHAWLRQDRLFEDRERELASWRHSGNVDHWQLSANVNYVSDDFYFKDLDTGLQVSAQTHLPRAGSARYRGPEWDVLVRAQSWQTIDPNLPKSDYPWRRLPQFHVAGNPALWGPLELLWLSDVTRFSRGVDLAGDVTGNRTHLEPGLALPLTSSWGYLEPRVRLYHTRYELDDVPTLPEAQPQRTLAGGSLDTGLFLERNFELNDTAWRQTLEPRLFFNKIEHEPQATLPDFDAGEPSFSWHQMFRENRFTGFDRIGDEESLSVGLTSRFLRSDSGAEVLRLRAGQQFYNEPRRIRLDAVHPDMREESPLLAEARFALNDRWRIDAGTHWNTDINRKQMVRGAIAYRGGERRLLHVGYQERRMVDNPVRQTEAAAFWAVHDNWSLLGHWLHDLDNERSLETMAGVEYRDCCWNIRLVNHRELSDRDGDTDLEAERTLLLQIRMVGLGGFGDRIGNLLERGLPGYEAP